MQVGRHINRDEVLISMSNSNSNYQNLIFEMFRRPSQKCKEKLCHSIYGSCRTQECPEVTCDHVNTFMSGANFDYLCNIFI